MKIRIQTRDLAIRNPTNNATFDIDTIQIKFYSWENISEPSLAPESNNNYCYLIINNLPTSTRTFSQNPSGSTVDTFDIYEVLHERFYEETPYQALSHRAPIEFFFNPSISFSTQSGNSYHTLKVHYPSTFGDVAMFKIRDLEVFRPVCYLANNRIRQCSIDTANNFMTISFQFALTANNPYHVKVSIIDPRNPDINGFLSSVALSDLVVSYIAAGTSTEYYVETDQFPTLFTLPSGISSGPFRGIIDGTFEYGHAMINQINVINLVLTFNRTDVTGLVFEIPLVDAAGTALYPTDSRLSDAFFDLEDGSTYPCGNHGLGAGGNVKCIILNGNNDHETTPTRIIMTDFTYSSQMNCRFIFRNP